MEPNATSAMSDMLQLHLVLETGQNMFGGGFAFLPGAQRLFVCYWDGTIGIWDTETGREERTSMKHKWGHVNLAVTRDGTKLVSSGGGEIKVWNVDSHALLEEWTVPVTRGIFGLGCPVAISLDGRLIAVGDQTLTLRHLDGGQEINHSIRFTGIVSSMCFSPDGHKLACVISGSLHVFDIEAGEHISPLYLMFSIVLWSHNDRLFYSGPTGEIHCLDPDTGEEIGQAWMGHTKAVGSLFLSLDGSKLASTSSDRTIRFWDATSGNPIGIHPLDGPGTFSPSGEFVAVRKDGKIYLWRVSWPDPHVESQVASALSPRDGFPLLPTETGFDRPSSPTERQGSQDSRTTAMRGWGRDRERDPLPLDNGDFHNSNAPEAPSWCGEADLSSRDQPTVISKPDGQMSRLSIGAPPPLDLTPYLVKISDRYSAGGGFGDVYRSWYYAGLVPKQVQVAVKAFRFRFTLAEDADIESHKMLRRELGIWRRLSHTNIVPFLGIAYGFGMHGAMSLVSLWMSNDTLQNFLAMHDDNLGVVHRLQFLLDIANGLQYLHSLSVVHGDLSCNNVLLDGDYTARLGDFGYASLVGNIPEVLTYLRRSTTRPGALRWIAPEQIDFENTFVRTTKSDIYSFGCLGLQVLSGKQPWSEVREDAAVVLRIARGYKPGRPASRPVDDLHWELIERCWLSIEERPAVETIVSFIQWFLSSYLPFQPLRDIMIMSDNSSIAEPSFGQAPTDASYTHVGTLDRENENRIASLPGLSGSVRFRQRDDSSDTSSGQVVAESHGESPYKRRRV